jgi:hypothetical protein
LFKGARTLSISTEKDQRHPSESRKKALCSSFHFDVGIVGFMLVLKPIPGNIHGVAVRQSAPPERRKK